MIQSFIIKDYDLFQLVEKISSSLHRKIEFGAIPFNKKLNFVEARKYLVDIFDNAEDISNIKYIGILEWAFVEELVDSTYRGAAKFNNDNVIRRFTNHPNIRVIKS